MRIFVFEHCCGGGMSGDPLDEELVLQGRAMLQAVLSDLSLAPGIEVVTTVDSRLRDSLHGVTPRLVHTPAACGEIFLSLARAADRVWVIAPESAGLLANWMRKLEQAGIATLNSDSGTVEITGSKWATYNCLRRNGVPTIPTMAIDGRWEPTSFPVVIKPADGAGCSDTFLVSNPRQWSEVRSWLERRAGATSGNDDRRAGDVMPMAGPTAGRMLAQPFVEGTPISVCFLAARNGRVTLPPFRQLIRQSREMEYQGGLGPVVDAGIEFAIEVANRCAALFPGLRGWVGIDMLLRRDGRWPFDEPATVVEINPRLTTSYLGMRQISSTNLALAVLKAVQSGRVDGLQILPRTVCFRADGCIAWPLVE